MSSTERVTIRLSTDSVDKMQELVASGQFETITDVIRAAVEEFLGKYYSPDNVKKVTVDLPKSNAVELETLVNDGDSISLDDAIRNAVREYTRTRLTKEE